MLYVADLICDWVRFKGVLVRGNPWYMSTYTNTEEQMNIQRIQKKSHLSRILCFYFPPGRVLGGKQLHSSLPFPLTLIGPPSRAEPEQNSKTIHRPDGQERRRAGRRASAGRRRRSSLLIALGSIPSVLRISTNHDCYQGNTDRQGLHSRRCPVGTSPRHPAFGLGGGGEDAISLGAL
jgi:hypothetical protein